MKNFRLAVLLLGLVVMGRPVAADFNAIKIHNLREDTVKVCAYSEESIVNIPLQCWTLAGSESVLWDRGKETYGFRLMIFRPALFDEELCRHRGLKDVSEVGVSPGCKISIVRRESGPTTPKPAPEPAPGPSPAKVYTLHACNATGTPVQFALAYGLAGGYGVEGWWIVPRRGCLDVPVSDLWIAQGDTHGEAQALWIYAKSGGGLITQFWEGSESDPALCVNQKKAFTSKQKDARFPELAGPCTGADLEVASFLRVPRPTSGTMYYWTFEG